jgi:hypothetical protein
VRTTSTWATGSSLEKSQRDASFLNTLPPRTPGPGRMQRGGLAGGGLTLPLPGTVFRAANLRCVTALPAVIVLRLSETVLHSLLSHCEQCCVLQTSSKVLSARMAISEEAPGMSQLTCMCVSAWFSLNTSARSCEQHLESIRNCIHPRTSGHLLPTMPKLGTPAALT